MAGVGCGRPALSAALIPTVRSTTARGIERLSPACRDPLQGLVHQTSEGFECDGLDRVGTFGDNMQQYRCASQQSQVRLHSVKPLLDLCYLVTPFVSIPACGHIALQNSKSRHPRFLPTESPVVPVHNGKPEPITITAAWYDLHWNVSFAPPFRPFSRPGRGPESRRSVRCACPR